MQTLLLKLKEIMWGPLMICFLLGSHVYFTYKTGFIQRYVFKGIKESLKKDSSEKGDLSVFGSLMTALSSTIGTGNITGTGLAIVSGGPGAILWMWLGGVFGIATKYAESYVAVKHRHIHSNGEYSGGAMVTFEKLNMPKMAKLFAWCCALGAFGIGCATQASAIAGTMKENFGISAVVTGLLLCGLTALVIFGGVKIIAKVCEKLVPIMSVVFMAGCVIILIINAKYLPLTFEIIFKSAFTGRAAFGGFVGSTFSKAISWGIERGLFSNESGMGSAPQATATSVSKNAVKPALVGSTGVFWDTVVVCLVIGLVIVSSIIGNDAVSCFDESGNVVTSAVLVSRCFSQIPYLGKPLLTFGILTFAYSTILGWSYYGENCIRYLFGHKSIKIYRALWIVALFVGVINTESNVWIAADILNAAMCIPNIIAVWLCKEDMVKDTKYYLFEDHLEEVDTSLE